MLPTGELEGLRGTPLPTEVSKSSIYHLRLLDSEPPVHTARLVFSECFPCWAESYKACISHVVQGTVAFWDETRQLSFTQPRICLVLQ